MDRNLFACPSYHLSHEGLGTDVDKKQQNKCRLPFTATAATDDGTIQLKQSQFVATSILVVILVHCFYCLAHDGVTDEDIPDKSS